MPKNTALISLLVVAQLVALAGGALGETSLMANTTNACIDSTFFSWSPSMAAPSVILIDRRLNVDPGACTTANSSNASCSIDTGQDYLIAIVTGTQITNVPFCSWNCAGAGCGSILTDGSIGLPVELMGFGFEHEDEEPPEDVDEKSEAASDRGPR